MKDRMKLTLRKGFTILELLLAVTIMSLISIAVFAVFRTATSAYKSGHRESLLLQRGRFAFDTFERDVMNIFYRDEDTYNEHTRDLIEEYQEDLLRAEETGDFEAFNEKYGPSDDDSSPNNTGNPFEKGKLIDLQFNGEDNGEKDRITFAVRVPLREGAPYSTWGLARIHYALEGDLLIRTSETVEANPRTWDGQVLEKEIPPEYTIVAEGVDEFDLSYGFWIDSQWFEVDGWTSSGRQIRNSKYLLGEYDEDDRPTDRGESQPGSTEFNEELNDQETEPYDALPTYVRIRLVLQDPENESSKTHLMRVFRVPSSQETWVSNEQLDEEERDMELDVRESKYIPVYPGALRKS